MFQLSLMGLQTRNALVFSLTSVELACCRAIALIILLLRAAPRVAQLTQLALLQVHCAPAVNNAALSAALITLPGALGRKRAEREMHREQLLFCPAQFIFPAFADLHSHSVGCASDE
jgi:NADH:ubiquinone oxidoreductase subunit K